MKCHLDLKVNVLALTPISGLCLVGLSLLTSQKKTLHRYAKQAWLHYNGYQTFRF